MIKKLNNQAFVLPSIIVMSLFMTTMAIIITDLAVSNFKIAIEDRSRLQSQFAADAGIELGIAALNNDNTWENTGGEVELSDNGITRSTYEVTTVVNASNSITLTSTGRAYEPVSSSTPKHERVFEVELRGIGDAGGSYSIVTGVGGLFMENSAKIVAGEVFVNGELDLQNSAQIGLTSSPVEVRVAHQNCPETGGAGYPQVCTSGEPVSIVNPARIYGDVCAINQTDGTRMQDGGLDPTCSGNSPSAPTPQPLPVHDRDAQKAAVTNTINSDYVCNSNSAKWTIPANTRITGDFDIRKKCEITILGDLWIEGEFSMINSAKLIVSDTLGTTMPDVMVDGTAATFNNSAQIIGNDQDTGAQLITYWSEATCSPDCADVTGDDLFNSREDVTILLQNYADAENSILYARWTQAQLDNGGDIGAIVGQTVKLTNSASVTFGASVGVGSGVSSIWLIDSYQRVQ